MRRRVRTVVRATGLLSGCATAVGVAWWLSADLLHPVLGPLARQDAAGLTALSFTDVLDAVCATVLLGCVVWLALGTTVTVASYAASLASPDASTAAVLETLADRGCPRLLRRLVLALLGAAIGAGAAAPATAHPGGLPDRPGTGVVAADGVSGLALPDRTTGAALAPERSGPADPGDPRRAGTTTRARTVLVGPGDSLWTIAADLLPPGATDHDVTEAWHRLHRANAARIGADPDLILPGTRLGVPDHLPTDREDR